MTRLVQFIAGAVCPKCKAVDKIAINSDNDQIYCVECDFKEDRPKDASMSSNTINVINLSNSD